MLLSVGIHNTDIQMNNIAALEINSVRRLMTNVFINTASDARFLLIVLIPVTTIIPQNEATWRFRWYLIRLVTYSYQTF